jgi:replicative DNA helicase
MTLPSLLSPAQSAEHSILGTVLLSPATLDVLSTEEGLRPEHFAVMENRHAYAAMLAIADEGEEVDDLVLAAKHQVPRWLLDLVPAAAAPAACREHARLVIGEHRWTARRRAALSALEACEGRDEDRYQAALAVDEPDRAPDALKDPRRLHGDLIAYLDDETGQIIPTPWEQLNRRLSGGLFPGDTTVLAGWSSHGKSLAAMGVLEHVSNLGGHCGLYTNEMSALQVTARLVSGLTEVPFDRIIGRRVGSFEREQIADARSAIRMNIVECHGWPAADICRHMRRMRWDICALDLFNRLPGRGRIQEVDQIVSSLCDAAAQSKAHLMVLAQLNRGRDDKAVRPTPTDRDIRESGSLGNDPANVMFVHREQEEIRDPVTDQMTGRVRRLNTGVIYVTKARNGDPDAAVQVRLVPERMRFIEMRVA